MRFKNLESMMNYIGATNASKKVLRFIVANKDTPGDLEPGQLKISLRDLAGRKNERGEWVCGAHVSLGTVVNALTFWQNEGVIHVITNSNKRECSTIQYLGVPQYLEEDPLQGLKEELERLKQSVSTLEASLDAILSQRKKNPAVFNPAKMIKVGELNGKTLFVFTGASEEESNLFNDSEDEVSQSTQKEEDEN
jgi:hypothetical protein